MPYLLGVDLGTTFTAAAVASGGEPTMVGLGNRALQIPSVLFYSDDGFVVGEAAERRGLVEPGRLVREFKRRLGDQVPVLVGGSPFSADALMAELLSWVVAQVTARMGEPPAGLVLTHPASWGPFRLEALNQVAVLADVGPVQWCAEPAAAAAQYAARARIGTGDRLAVYDLGGGTFDVCVLEKTADGFVMLGPPEGVEHLGGADFDEALFQLVLRGLGAKVAEVDPDDPQMTTGLARLRRDCVEAKEALSSEVDVDIPVSLPGVGTSVRVTRSEFEGLIRPTLRQTVQAMARAIRSATLTPTQLAGIVLVGGSSRIPLVGELLQREFGVPTAIDTHPKHDIALGAVRLIQDRAGASGPSDGIALRPTPMPIVRPGPAAVSPSSPETVAPLAPARAEPPAEAPRRTTRSAAPLVTTPPVVPPVVAPPPVTPSPVTPSPDEAVASASSTAASPGAATPGTATPATAAPAPPSSGSSAGARRLSPKLLVVTGVTVAVLAGAIGIGLAVARSKPDAGPPLSSTGTAASTSAGPSNPPSPTRTARVRALPGSAALADSQLVVPMKVDGNWDLYLADATADTPALKLTKGSGLDTFPSLSPDRRTVIYVHRSSKTATPTLRVAAAADGSGDRPLFTSAPQECARSISRPAWNPSDPTMVIAPCMNAAGWMGLYEISIGGTVSRRIDLGGDNTRVGDPAISPDGKTLAFWVAPDDQYDGGTLMTVPTDGSAEAVPLIATTMPGQDADPVWSPDGTSIAFRRRAGTADHRLDLNIWRVDVILRSRPRQLTTSDADEQDPSWSPDGDRIAFKSARQTRGSKTGAPIIWVMGSDGSDQRPLFSAGSVGEQTAAAWSRR